MPHLTVEYSANLDPEVDPRHLCDALHRTLMESGLFEPGAPRVRALCCGAYAIADRDPENAFADMVLRMGQGRAEADRRRLGEALMVTAAGVFADRLSGRHFALSLEIVEISGPMSWKRNTIHDRLRAAR